MTIDNRGNVYLTSKAVDVYNRRGEKVAEIQVPEGPANVTFAGKDNRTLFITARTSLYAVEMQVRGAKTPLRPGTATAQPAKQGKESKQRKQQK
jgi:gluconolactonase